MGDITYEFLLNEITGKRNKKQNFFFFYFEEKLTERQLVKFDSLTNFYLSPNI